VKIGMIGRGAIAGYVRRELEARGHVVGAVIVRDARRTAQLQRADGANGAADPDGVAGRVCCVASAEALPSDITHMIDCAGPAALASHGPDILRRGIDLTSVSIAGLANERVVASLEAAAAKGRSRLHLVSGAIGALDCLSAARVGTLERVAYTGRKPPQAWKGSPAEDTIDLDALTDDAVTHFEGSAREAAIAFPKNANVAAAVALAGIGMDATRVRLIADPRATANIHEIEASGEFGTFHFRIEGRALPDNPRSSALTAMSVVDAMEQRGRAISFR